MLRDFSVRVTRVPLQFIVRDESGKFLPSSRGGQGVHKAPMEVKRNTKISRRSNLREMAVKIAIVTKVLGMIFR